VGYSFGGGVGMSFTRYLPHLVQSLTLITPGGLIRPYHVGWQSKVLYSEGFLPEFLLEYLVKRRLETPSPSATKNADVGVIGASAELPKAERRKHAGNSDASGGDGYDDARLLKRHPHISVGSAVSWQISDHVGFIPAFMSSFRHGPIYNQHAVWAIVGSRLSEQKLHPADKAARKQGLLKSKVLMVLGATDPVIVAEEVIEDAKEVLGEGNVEIAVLDAGHEVPITKSAEVAEVIWRFWTCEE
jgi:pimeloyl-ACP methyl ester carboxylesterase